MTAPDDLTRIEALRLLLAAHTPTPDDNRSGHRYIYPKADARVHMDWRTRMLARFDRVRRVAS